MNGNIPGGNFSGGFPGGSLMGGNFQVEIFREPSDIYIWIHLFQKQAPKVVVRDI